MKMSVFFLSIPCNYQTLLYHCFIVIAFLIKENTCGFNTCNMSSKIHQHYLIVHEQVKKVMHVCLQGWCFVLLWLPALVCIKCSLDNYQAQYSLWKMLDCVLFVLEVIFLTTAIWDAKITILFVCKEGRFLI